MRILIAYATKSGTTEKAARLLQAQLPNAVLANIKKEKPSLESFDTILLGGSVRISQVHKAVKKFMAKNKAALLEKNLGLFICCGVAEKAEDQLKANYPADLREHARAVTSFGGEMDPAIFKGLEKAAAKSIANDPDAPDVSIDTAAIAAFAQHFINE